MLLLYLVLLPVLSAMNESCFEEASGGRGLTEFEAVVYFNKTGGAEQLKTGMKVEKFANSFLVTRYRPFPEYLVVTPAQSRIRQCKRDSTKVFEDEKLVCIEKGINQLVYSLLPAKSCAGSFLTLTKVDQVVGKASVSAENLHQQLGEKSKAERNKSVETFIYFLVFAVLGGAFVFSGFVFFYIQFKTALLEAVNKKNPPSMPPPPKPTNQSGRKSPVPAPSKAGPLPKQKFDVVIEQGEPSPSMDMTTMDTECSKLISREKMGLMVKRDLKIPTRPKVPVVPKVLEKKDEV